MATIIKRKAHRNPAHLKLGAPFDGVKNLEVRNLVKKAHAELLSGFADMMNEIVSKPHEDSVWFEAEITPERINIEFSSGQTDLKLISKKRMLDHTHSPFGMSGGTIAVLPDDRSGVCYELMRRYPTSKNLLTKGGFKEYGPPRRPKKKVTPEIFSALLAETLVEFAQTHSSKHVLNALQPLRQFKREMANALLKQKSDAKVLSHRTSEALTA